MSAILRTQKHASEYLKWCQFILSTWHFVIALMTEGDTLYVDVMPLQLADG
jgi:hypothetical protein